MGYSISIIKQVIIMFLITCVGVLCYKRNILTKDVEKKLSSLVLRVVNPCFIFMSYQIDYSSDMLKGLLIAFALSIATHLIFIFASNILIRKNKCSEYIIERFSIIYTNCGFMGIPLVNGVFGSEGVLYATAYLTVFNIFVWSHGVMTMRNSFSKDSILQVLKSPAIIAIALGLLCYVTKIRVPEIIGRSLDYVSSMNTPLAMITAGLTIAQTRIIEIIKNKRIILITLLRLFVFPAAAIMVLSFLPISDDVFMPVMLTACCPTAAIGTLFAVQYDKNASYSSQIFSISAILSVLSMPLMILFMEFVK